MACGARQHHAAGLQHIAAMRDLQRKARILLDHEERDALLVDGLNQFKQFDFIVRTVDFRK